MLWSALLQGIITLIIALVGIAVREWLRKRPQLVTYMTHANAITLRPEGANPIPVHTHSVVIRNTGKLPAHNVRLGHFVLPDYSIFPPVAHEVTHPTTSAAEIVFPALAPGEEVTIAYLYFPPLIAANVHAYTKADECLAHFVAAFPQPPPAKPLALTALTLMFLGAAVLLGAFIYGILQLISAVPRI